MNPHDPEHESATSAPPDEEGTQLSVPDTIRRLSTAQLLSLLTSAILLAALAIAVGVTARSLRQSAVVVAQDRLNRGVRQLALVSAAGIRQSEGRYKVVARDSAIRRVLASGDAVDVATLAAARSALASLLAPTDSGMPIELWSASGRRLAFVGEDIPDSIALRPRAEIRSGQPPLRPGLDSLRQTDSLQLSKLYEFGDRTDVWVVLPIVERGRTLGFIAQHRWITANPQVEQTIRGLSGDSVSGYYRNTDGTMLTTFGGIRPPQPEGGPATAVETGGDADSLLYAEEVIAGTPLVLGMKLPRRVVEDATENTIRRLGLLGVTLTITAAVLAWLVGRAVARPIVRVTDAAAAVAGGDYSTRVPSTGTREASRLAESFNRMASQIGESRVALESREEALREARDAAEKANRAKMDFLAAMSHELRTPLNAIGGYTEIIEMGLRGPVTEEQREDLSRIRANQRHLLGLIAGILDMSRLETGRVTYYLETVVLDPLLAGLEALIAPQAASKQQVLDYRAEDRKLAVHADAEKLKQIMLNLLSNAIRHSPAGSAITVEAHAQDEQKVAISVTDTGPGIPADRRESVFEPFVQLDRSLTGPAEGVGLGLAISRDLARGMGGELSVEAGDHEGARFTVVLPRAHAVA